MGASLCNFQVRSESQKDVCNALRKIISIRAFVSPAQNRWVSVFDELSNSINEEEIKRVGKALSEQLATVVIAFAIHHSDVMIYYFFNMGKELDYYNSTPDYFGSILDKNQFDKTKGDAELFIKCIDKSIKKDDIEKVLFRKPAQEISYDEKPKYVLQEERLRALFSLLHINENYAEIGFHDFFEEGISQFVKNRSKFKLVARRGALKKIEELFKSIDEDNIAKVKDLIRSGLSPNTKTNDRLRQPALRNAVLKGNIEMVKFLIESGATIYSYIFIDAIKNKEIVKFLIKSGADIYSGLYAACYKGDMEDVKMFLDLGANINAVNANGESALIYHSCCGHYAMVKFLIGEGADLHIKDSYGHTAISAVQERLREWKEIDLPKEFYERYDKTIDILEKAERINQSD